MRHPRQLGKAPEQLTQSVSIHTEHSAEVYTDAVALEILTPHSLDDIYHLMNAVHHIMRFLGGTIMRYTKDHKRQTRERIIQIASGRFRQQGFEGVGIGELMSELELTHGGFYRHFADKESLYAETLTFSIDDVQRSLLKQQPGADTVSLREIITAYLSTDHCENPANGCPVAALSADVARQSNEVQSVFEAALQHYMDNIIHLMPGTTEAERKSQFLVLFSGMAGVVSVARAVSDHHLRATILNSARDFYIHTFCE
jgi:TetR/AcrR family transcriptional repressor of nem operon